MSATIDRRQRKREYETRYAENPWRKWYSNAPWKKAARRQLAVRDVLRARPNRAGYHRPPPHPA